MNQESQPEPTSEENTAGGQMTAQPQAVHTSPQTENQPNPLAEEKPLPLTQAPAEQAKPDKKAPKEPKTTSVAVLVTVAILIALLLTILTVGVYRGL